MRFQIIHLLSFLTLFESLVWALPADPDLFDPPTVQQVVVRQRNTQPGEFQTINAALTAISDAKGPQTILVHPGEYHEQVIIQHKHPLVLRGYSENAYDYRNNQVKIIGSRSAAQTGSNANSATVLVAMNNFSMYNIDIVNDYGVGTDTQAVALSAKGVKHGYYGCSFDSFQDTLRSYLGVHLFSRCFITGGVDFFFGVDARSYVYASTVAVKASPSGKESITASGRQSANSPGFIVFDHANVVSADINGAAPGSASLGRPWGRHARTTFQFSTLSDVIGPQGWSAWNPPAETRLEHADFQEYQNKGPGAFRNHSNGHTASRAMGITEILGSDVMSWADPAYVA